MNKPTISIIAAHDKNKNIGQAGKLPWNLPADLKRFKEITIGHPIIMGRKTFDSIGRPLPKRDNIIITRGDLSIPGVTITHSLEEALAEAKKKTSGEIFIIGGGEIYRQAMELADKLYLTLIDKEFTGDTFFPDYNQFKETRRETHQGDEFTYHFVELKR